MKVLIVYAHPNPQSFNHAILESFTKGLTEAKHTYEVIDLYAIKFNPVLSIEDLVKRSEGKVSDELKGHQEKISQAQGIVFIYPIWWYDPPAILKGWIDRVFSVGFAYMIDIKEGKAWGLLKNQKALIINTAGGMEEDAKLTGSTDALKKIEDDLIFRFCGINDVQHVIFYNVILVDDATRKGYLEDARNLGKTF